MTSAELAYDILTAAESTSRIWLTPLEREALATEFGKKIDAHRAPLVDMLDRNLSVWEDEEKSVQEEHADLIQETRDLLKKLQ